MKKRTFYPGSPLFDDPNFSNAKIEAACRNFLKEGKGHPKELHVDEKTFGALKAHGLVEFCWINFAKGAPEPEVEFAIPIRSMPFPEMTAQFIGEVEA